jgi:hypothetical protein
MNEFLFEYYYDPVRIKCCLHCKHYDRFMLQSDGKRIGEINKVDEIHKYGQKYCIKNKVFVYMSDACGEFSEWLNASQKFLRIKQNPFEDYE